MKCGRWLLILTIVVAFSISLRIYLGQRSDSEDRQAWKEFGLIVHPVESGAGAAQPPEWISWATKCEVGFSTACDDSSRKFSAPADRTAAEIPRQVLDEFSKIHSQGKQQSFVLDYAVAPQLAGVLYNPIAKDSILRNKLYDARALNGVIKQLDSENVPGAKRRLPPGSFATGSEIVKLMWEIIPDIDGQALHLYDPAHPIKLDDTRLDRVGNWTTQYQIDRDRSKPCPKLGGQLQAQTIPIKCFYSFPIDKNNPCSILSKEVRFVWGCDSDDMGGRKFLVFLVGFHIMKLTEENPDWRWSTYYWTRETNEAESGYKWDAPWNHFHQMTTTAIREDAQPPHEICYNPYLEGSGDHGLQANCLSCHSFAAYAPDVNKVGSGVGFGAEYPYPEEKRLQDEQKYFLGAVQTSFVWSISISQNKPDGGPDRTSFQNMLRNTLQEQFQHQ